jgi:hypothetical protein
MQLRSVKNMLIISATFCPSVRIMVPRTGEQMFMKLCVGELCQMGQQKRTLYIKTHKLL